MTSAVDKPEAGRRRRDAAASRRALLDAAGELFETRGYEATTVREIGERAGVDAALIARYFGGKEGLYLATVAEAPAPAPLTEPLQVVERVLRRSESRGLGPVGLALVSPTLTDAMREQVRELTAARLVEPAAERLAARGVAEPRLRAELLVATALGVSLTRAAGALPALREASLEELLEAVEPLVAPLCEGRR